MVSLLGQERPLLHQLLLLLLGLSLAPLLEGLEVLGGDEAVAEVDAEGVEREDDEQEGGHANAE